MTQPLKDRTYIITGAGKGLGRAYALHLAGLGANLVVNNRRHAGESRSSAERVVDEIVAGGGSAIAEHSEAEAPDCGERLLASALEAYGRVDGLVANAGVSEGRTFNKQDPAEFRRVIEINLMGTVHAVHPVYRHFYAQRRGAIIVSTSVAGLYSEHGLPAYSTSKAGLLGFMRALSQEGRGHDVRVNALAPYASTGMTEDSLSEAMRERMRPERVAPAVAWLLSDECRVTGEIVIAGGGLMTTAGVREPEPVEVPDDADPATLDRAWQALCDRPLDKSYRSSLDHFAGFMGAP
ncbi:MAG: SDR family NAD(P)-dependent oxidoreductase [Lysobacterales bacterium]|jgi:NAD(P)-dependent dehydrogenase (short-subunit alcohol dehydrogenase family)